MGKIEREKLLAMKNIRNINVKCEDIENKLQQLICDIKRVHSTDDNDGILKKLGYVLKLMDTNCDVVGLRVELDSVGFYINKAYDNLVRAGIIKTLDNIKQEITDIQYDDVVYKSLEDGDVYSRTNILFRGSNQNLQVLDEIISNIEFEMLLKNERFNFDTIKDKIEERVHIKRMRVKIEESEKDSNSLLQRFKNIFK